MYTYTCVYIYIHVHITYSYIYTYKYKNHTHTPTSYIYIYTCDALKKTLFKELKKKAYTYHKCTYTYYMQKRIIYIYVLYTYTQVTHKLVCACVYVCLCVCMYGCVCMYVCRIWHHAEAAGKRVHVCVYACTHKHTHIYE